MHYRAINMLHRQDKRDWIYYNCQCARWQKVKPFTGDDDDFLSALHSTKRGQDLNRGVLTFYIHRKSCNSDFKRRLYFFLPPGVTWQQADVLVIFVFHIGYNGAFIRWWRHALGKVPCLPDAWRWQSSMSVLPVPKCPFMAIHELGVLARVDIDACHSHRHHLSLTNI